MLSFIIKFVAGLIKLHPDTWKSRTFLVSLLGGLGTCGYALGTCLDQKDPNVLHYVACFLPLIGMLLPMYIRDAQAKGHAKSAELAQKILDIVSKVGSVAPLLLIGLFLFAFTPRVSATETYSIVDKPFKYFLSTIDTAYLNGTAFYGVTPTTAVKDLAILNPDSGKSGVNIQYLNAAGAGLDYGRYIKSSDGKVYETFGASILIFISSQTQATLGGVFHVFNRELGLGGGVNLGNVPKSQRYQFWIVTQGRLF